MSLKSISRLRNKEIIIPIIGLMLLSCEFLVPKSHVTPLSPASIILYDKTHIAYQGDTEVLDINVGHFAKGTYQTVSGNKESGLTATMWIQVQGSMETSQSIWVYPGKIVVFMDYRIQILRIEMDQPGVGFVEFEIAMKETKDTPLPEG